MQLNTTGSPISRDERNNLNENWQRIINEFNRLQRQINILSGNEEVDEILERIDTAINSAETTTFEMQELLVEVNAKLNEIQTSITNANNAADDANTLNVALTLLKDELEILQTNLQGIVDAESRREQNENARIQAETDRDTAEQSRVNNESARNDAETARQQAEQSRVAAEEAREETFDLKMLTADEKIALMQDLISNLKSYNYDSGAVYDFPNLITYNGSTFIALQEVSGITPTNDGVNYRLVAQRGVDGTGAVSTVNDVFPDENGNVEISIPNVLNDLESTSTTEALSANQGRLLKALIDALETAKAEQTALEETNTNVTNISNDLSTLSQTVSANNEEVTRHLADLVSESIVVTRDLTLNGIQRVTTSKKPKAITLIASQYNSKSIHGYCSENGDQGCNYRTNNGEIGDTNLAILAGDSLDNRTDGQLSNFTDTGFDINWTKIGTGATGTLTIRFLVIYHGKGVV